MSPILNKSQMSEEDIKLHFMKWMIMISSVISRMIKSP